MRSSAGGPRREVLGRRVLGLKLFGGRVLGRSSLGGYVVSGDFLPAGVTTCEYGACGLVKAGVLNRCRGSAKLVLVPGFVGGGRGAFDPKLVLLDDLPAGNFEGCLELRGPG